MRAPSSACCRARSPSTSASPTACRFSERRRADMTRAPQARPFYHDLSFQVLAGMLLGVAVGHFLPAVGVRLQPLGDVFIRLISMAVGPVIFCSVVGGIAGAGDMKKVGRVALVALIYFEVVTSIALVIGLVAINVFKPGAGMNVDLSTLNTSQAASYIKTAAA